MENWYQKNRLITGGEIHAYMVHHLLNRRLVIPIPDFWITGLAILVGKSLYIFIFNTGKLLRTGLIITSFLTIVLGLVGLEIYLTANILLPWLLPVLVFWFYFMLPQFLGKKNA